MGERQSTSLVPVVLALRLLGTIDMLAVAAVVMPAAWMQFAHEAAGLGEFPQAPIAGYLARSASALYALHGLIVFKMSYQVVRYWQLIRFMATMALFHGLIMLFIDLTEGMPLWWTILEGPAFSFTGGGVLLAQQLSLALTRRAPTSESPRLRPHSFANKTRSFSAKNRSRTKPHKPNRRP